MPKFPIHYVFLAISVALFVIAYQHSGELGYVLVDSKNPALPNFHAGLSCLAFALAGGLSCIASAICWHHSNRAS